MQWITRERPTTERIACPWLIRRFIDPDAEFVYVPGERILELELPVYDALFAWCQRQIETGQA